MGENIAIAAKCALVSDNNKVLLLRKTPEEMNGDASKNNYDLPGGRIKYGEEIEEGLRRELLEELGIVCNEFALKTTWSIIRPDGLHLHILLYMSVYKNQSIKLSSEHEGYQWVGMKDDIIQSMPSWIYKAVSCVLDM